MLKIFNEYRRYGNTIDIQKRVYRNEVWTAYLIQLGNTYKRFTFCNGKIIAVDNVWKVVNKNEKKCNWKSF